MKHLTLFVLIAALFATSSKANDTIQSELNFETDSRTVVVKGSKEPLSREVKIKNIDLGNIKKVEAIDKNDEKKMKPFLKQYGNKVKDGVIVLTLKNPRAGVRLIFNEPVISKRKFPHGVTGKPDNDPVYSVVTGKRAEFPGSEAALLRFIKDNLRYPARAQKVEGRIIIEVVIERSGEWGNVRIKRSMNNIDLEMEAIRVIGLMPEWEPAYQDGKPVRSLRDINFVWRVVSQDVETP